MKHPALPIRSFLAIAAMVVSGPGGHCALATEAMGEAAPGFLRVMSFNVRLSSANDGVNAWERRSDLFLETFRDFGPDLVGCQEVMADQYDALIERLPEFAFSGSARDDGKRKGEWAPIGFRKQRFSVIENGDFWLSEHPDVAGSKSWDAALTRVCSWVRLRDAVTGREFVFANTHFDHKGVIARMESGKVIAVRLAAIANGAPVILTGDFNLTEDDPAYETLIRPGTPNSMDWIDAFRTVYAQRSPDELSFHGFKGGSTGSRIDFILHTTHFTSIDASIDRSYSPDGRFPSDHYAVTALLRTAE